LVTDLFFRRGDNFMLADVGSDSALGRLKKVFVCIRFRSHFGFLDSLDAAIPVGPFVLEAAERVVFALKLLKLLKGSSAHRLLVFLTLVLHTILSLGLQVGTEDLARALVLTPTTVLERRVKDVGG
jgi:hypothetical protein